MNPRLARLERYPFERMNDLKAGTDGNPEHAAVSLSIGEPRHPPPSFVVEALADGAALTRDLGTYPATRGEDALREAIAAWIGRRFRAHVDPASQVLPVAGTREALFSFAQSVLSGRPGSLCLLPNPFYQIYEGAALLGGATPYFLNTGAGSDYQPDFDAVPEAVWDRCELLFVCSPGNPTGKVLPAATARQLLSLADRHDFVIASDECYSEIYPDEAQPPCGFLEAAAADGRTDFRRLVVFHSLSKRSNLPGLRSGFVAGDAAVLERYYQYRTYEGCALPAHTQRVSALAWADEVHVRDNRDRYREKFATVTPILRTAFAVQDPDAGFYHWLPVGGDDQRFALAAFAATNITVLPGSFIAREAHGTNPGAGHVRVAWVAPLEDASAAARRLAAWAAGTT